MEGKLLPSLYDFKKIFAYLSCVSSHSDLLQLDFRKYSLQKEILALASATRNYRSIIYHTHQYNITLTAHTIPLIIQSIVLNHLVLRTCFCRWQEPASSG